MRQTVESNPENFDIVNYLRNEVLSMSGDGNIVEPDVLYQMWPDISKLVPRVCEFDLYSIPVLVHPATHVVFGVAYQCLLKLPENDSLRYRRGWFLQKCQKGIPFSEVSGWWRCSTESGNPERCLAAYRAAGKMEGQ